MISSSFNIDELDRLFPPDLSVQKKDRLTEGLKQFLSVNNNKDKYYYDFYSTKNYSYFQQGDLIRELRFSEFNEITRQYQKIYCDALLLSTTCDMDDSNKRKVPKSVVIAPLIPIKLFIESLDEIEIENKIEILTSIRNQQYTNVFYLPPTFDGSEHIAFLDTLSWINIDELNILKDDMNTNRIASLEYFGYYLFVFKLSFHFCRLPEVTER